MVHAGEARKRHALAEEFATIKWSHPPDCVTSFSAMNQYTKNSSHPSILRPCCTLSTLSPIERHGHAACATDRTYSSGFRIGYHFEVPGPGRISLQIPSHQWRYLGASVEELNCQGIEVWGKDQAVCQIYIPSEVQQAKLVEEQYYRQGYCEITRWNHA
jgi:hypothetical protein